MNRFIAACVLGLATAAGVAGNASASDGVRVGVLMCNIAGGFGYVITSSKDVDCVFAPSHHQWRDHYVGLIVKVGADIGLTTGGHLVWAVFAPGKVDHGSLSGSYFGATGEATIGIGVGANVLLGGFQSSVNLQPVSVQMQTGLNVAGGIASLSLRSH